MGLSRDIVLKAALNLVNREGLDRLTMRRLGADLDVEAMSLYRYVESKTDLYDGMLEVVVSEVELPEPSGDWTADVVAAGVALFDTLAEHPRALPLLASRPAVTPGALRMLEAALALLAQDGVPTAQALARFDALFGYVVGFALTQIGGGEEEFTVAYTQLDPAHHPHLSTLAAVLAARDPRATFLAGLRAMASGFAA